MSLILSGTDGLSDVDGSAATPAIRGTDANTGMFFPAADTIAFSEGGVESMRIDSSGNLLVGATTSLDSAFKLQVVGTGGSVVFQNTTNTNNIRFANANTANVEWSVGTSSTGLSNAGNYFSITQLNGGSWTERLRINANGNLALSGANQTANGVGITFPATQSASSDANTLDDYEEGTWTPVITSEGGSITAYSSSGTYTKVGNNVRVTGYVDLTTVGTASGRLFIAGFPFAGTSTTDFIQPACPVREANSTGYIYFAYINGANTNGVIQNSTAGGIAWTNSYKYSWTITYKC